MNTTKKNLSKKYVFFSNEWIYSLSLGFLMLSLIWFTKLMLSSDKAVINAMINYDMNVAEMNLTASEAETALAPDTSFSTATLMGK